MKWEKVRQITYYIKTTIGGSFLSRLYYILACKVFVFISMQNFALAEGAKAKKQDDLSRQNIMIVLNSRTAKQKLDECSIMYNAPYQLKFTILIDENGNAEILEVNPPVKGLLQACFLKAFGNLNFPSTGKRFKIVYSYKFSIKQEDRERYAEYLLESPKKEHEGIKPREEEYPLFNRGKITAITGISLMGVFYTAHLISHIAGYTYSSIHNDGFFISLGAAITLITPVISGGITSLVGLHVMKGALGLQGIDVNRSPLIFAWWTLLMEIPIATLAGSIGLIESAVRCYDCPEDYDPPSDQPFMWAFSLGTISILFSLVTQGLYFRHLLLRHRYAQPSKLYSFVPVIALNLPSNLQTKTSIWTLTWFF